MSPTAPAAPASPAYDKLVALLRELFQLDQPELDFGLYRVLRARATEIDQFLRRDLLPQVRTAFAQYQPADRAALQKDLAQAIAQAEAVGVDPEVTPKVKELRLRIDTESVDLGGLEREVFDHLYAFFRRYYAEGDFLAKRVYKSGVYAIPYEGEEVKLHWANRDQYYIKTSEYLRDYAFRLRPDAKVAAQALRTHFRLSDAAEGEHHNVKAAEGKERVFNLRAGEDFYALNAATQELSLFFEYRPATFEDWPAEVAAALRKEADETKKKLKLPTQKELLDLVVKRILAVTAADLQPWLAELQQPHTKTDGTAATYSRLRAHLDKYVARNTFDYFIHKDLGNFLSRELDFYLKSEVLHLDNIDTDAASKVEQYLSKLRVVRKVARHIIAFLAQLEDFQRKLWLKKKFVVDTQWCLTLDKVPAGTKDTFLAEIAANEAQRLEWVELFGIEALAGDAVTPAYSAPLTVEFLRAYPNLVLDTRHFPAAFTQRLLAGLEGNLDELTDGLLIYGENFQALNLLQERYKEQVDCVYIDPPYNTGGDGFAYKDNYQHSSWMTSMENRYSVSLPLLSEEAPVFSSINDIELFDLIGVNELVFGEENRIGYFTWKSRSKPTNAGDAKYRPQKVAEYILGYSRNASKTKYFEISSGLDKVYPHQDTLGKYRTTTILTSNMGTYKRETMRFTVNGFTPDETQRWKGGEDFIHDLFNRDRVGFREDNSPFLKVYEEDDKQSHTPFYTFMDPEATGTAEDGKTLLNSVLTNKHGIDTVKPVEVIELMTQATTKNDALILDYFAGSGTTGHAVINLNRADGGKRKFILVEMGGHFDTVVLPRLKKVTYSPEWKDGHPRRQPTSEEMARGPKLLKVIRLESYEDTLNNLELKELPKPAQTSLFPAIDTPTSAAARQDYMLRYLLDVETRGSRSLLDVPAFRDPTQYALELRSPDSDNPEPRTVDLLETFNYLLGLRVRQVGAPQSLAAAFERTDHVAPHDGAGRLRLKGALVPTKADNPGPWWVRPVTGTLADGRRVLVIWRNLTADSEQDNLVLNAWFEKHDYSVRDTEFDLIYVNGDHNLENLRQPNDTWKVQLTEEAFHRLLFTE